MSADLRLFAVYLGGRAAGCNTELHDVVFVTGQAIEDTYELLLGKWFGVSKGLHIDSWVQLDAVDGFRVGLSATPEDAPPKLWFVNLGAYREGEFTEVHANAFMVAGSAAEAKARVKASLLAQGLSQVHTDDLYEVDSCVRIDAVGDLHVRLDAGAGEGSLRCHNAYHPIPEAIVEAFVARHGTGQPRDYRAPYD
jgi:hypothetical protein